MNDEEEAKLATEFYEAKSGLESVLTRFHNLVAHTSTLEEYHTLQEILFTQGYKWNGQSIPMSDSSGFKVYGNRSCVQAHNFKLTHGSYEYYQSIGRVIIDMEAFCAMISMPVWTPKTRTVILRKRKS